MLGPHNPSFFRRLLFVQENPVVIVTTCKEHTRTIFGPFLMGDDIKKKNPFILLHHILHILGPENATL